MHSWFFVVAAVCCTLQLTKGFLRSSGNNGFLSKPTTSSRISLGASFLDVLFKPKTSSNNAAQKAKIESLKADLVTVSTGTSNGIKATEDQRLQIATIVKDLEKLNAVKKIASSDMMNGNWKLIYTTNEGSSAGKLGPFVGRVDQLITVDEQRYINFVRLGNGIITGALTATWDNLGDKLWQVKFLDIELKAFGIPITKKPLGAVGTWRMSYLDDDLRILYAAGGKNTVKENIYILAKDSF